MKSIPSITVFVMLVLVSGLSAAVPPKINYQGRLTDAGGTPLTGARAMSIKVYNASTAGTLLYSEVLGLVPVDANGIYGFQFGANGIGSPANITAILGGPNEHWLELTVDGVVQQPRQKLLSVPFALMAKGLADGSITSSMIAERGIGIEKINGLGTAATANAADFAAKASPAFSGIPTAPTAALGTNSSQLATTAFVQANGGNPGGVIYAKSYGVKADGVTNDTAALQAAIDAAATVASSSSRATVVLPSGLLRLSRTSQTGIGEDKQAINLKSNVNLVGQGIGASVLKLLDSVPENTPTLLANHGNSANIMISNLTIDGNAINRACTGGSEDEGINFKDGTDIVISHVEVRNCGQDGLDLDGGTRIIISDCTFTDNYGNGIHAVGGGPDRMLVSNCYFKGNGFVRLLADGFSGAGLDSIGNICISNCYFNDNAREIKAFGGIMYVTNCQIVHTLNVRGLPYDAVEASSSNSDATLVLDNCRVTAIVGNGVRVKNGHPKIVVQNCRINSAVGDAVNVADGREVIVRGNTLSGRYGVYLGATTLPAVIENNVFAAASSSLFCDHSANGSFSGNFVRDQNPGAVHVYLRTGTIGWHIINNRFPSTGSGINLMSGVAGTVILGNTGNFDLFIGGEKNLVKNNQIDAVAFNGVGAVASVMEDNTISGLITHTGVSFASNVWRRNTGPGCSGVFYGNSTLVSGSTVVASAAANPGRKIALYRQSPNGSSALGQLVVGAIVPNNSFTVNSLSATVKVETGDTSTIFWEILE